MCVDNQAQAPTDSRSRRPYGYWNNFEHVEQELHALLRSFQAEGYMPTTAVLLQAGRTDLLGAIQRHGGLILVATRLGLKPWRQRASATAEAEAHSQSAGEQELPAAAEAESAAVAPAAESAVGSVPAAEQRSEPPAAAPDNRRQGPRNPGQRQQPARRQPPAAKRGPGAAKHKPAQPRSGDMDRRGGQKIGPSSYSRQPRVFRMRCRKCGREIISKQHMVLTCKDCQHGSR